MRRGAGAEADGFRVGLPKSLRRSKIRRWVSECRVERSQNTGDEKEGGEEKVCTYCPQREPEEGYKQRRSVPA